MIENNIKMKNIENISSRRKFMTMGASTAAVLLGGAALTNKAQATSINGNVLSNGTSVIHSNVKCMVADNSLKLGDSISTLGYHQIGDDGDNIYIGDGSEVRAVAVLDAHFGPIIIESNSCIDIGSLIQGPVYIGPDCRINPQ